jgi:hypothetical protein
VNTRQPDVTGRNTVQKRWDGGETRTELMPDGHSTTLQRCALPGCGETIVQPECGGTPQAYCSPDHRVTARKLRRIARFDADEQQPLPRAHRQAHWLTDPFSIPSEHLSR